MIKLRYVYGFVMLQIAAGLYGHAHAQAISCGATAIAKADANNATKLGKDADCFDKAGAIAQAASKARRDRIVAITPKPAPTPAPAPTPSTKPIRLYVGDSLSIEWAGNHTGIDAKAHPELDVRSDAVGGSGIAQILGARLTADLVLHPRDVIVVLGANDLVETGLYPTPADYVAAEFRLTDQFKALGARVFVATILPQCLANAALHNSRRVVANTLIRAAAGTRIDGVIDYAADPTLGPDAAACDTNVYQDGVHPYDVTAAGKFDGQGRMAAIDEAALGSQAPVVPAPAPSPTGVQGAIASGLDIASLLQPAWGTGAIPAHDVDVGAFRFLCAPGQINWDDPILYPGVMGGSPHPHQWFGNNSGNFASSYASLRTTGDSSCNNALNRSGYWVQVMMHPSGKAVMPDWFAIYYKRMPATDPRCQVAAKACVEMPRGLRFVFGYNMSSPSKSDPSVWRWWNCPDGTTPGHYDTIAQAAQGCPDGHQIEFAINSPDCWNGADLDSPDHRSHMAYRYYDGAHSFPVCPAGYPYIVPQITEEGFYTTDAQASGWYLYADRMPGMATMPAGSTLHADWFGAWEDSIMDRWTANCIDKLLSCSGGDLGDGMQLKTLHGYSYATGPVLVDVPTRPN